MDYTAAIERVYDHVENDQVDKAVMMCLRISRNLHDYLYAAAFLREMYPNKREWMRILYDDISHLRAPRKISAFQCFCGHEKTAKLAA
jgi:hypothetical protein